MTVKGLHRSPETRAKISASMQGHVPSAETRRKQSLANMGRACSEEARRKLSIIGKSRPIPPEIRAKMAASLSVSSKGHPVSLETRKKMSSSQTGKILSEETRKKLSVINKGNIISPETREKISIALKGRRVGESNPAWKGGISRELYCPKFNRDLKKRIRFFFENRCVICGKTKEENARQLSCHHVNYSKGACCDGVPVYFAALCGKCHAQTNNDRAHWENVLHRIIDEIYDGKSYFTCEEWIREVRCQS